MVDIVVAAPHARLERGDRRALVIEERCLRDLVPRVGRLPCLNLRPQGLNVLTEFAARHPQIDLQLVALVAGGTTRKCGLGDEPRLVPALGAKGAEH